MNVAVTLSGFAVLLLALAPPAGAQTTPARPAIDTVSVVDHAIPATLPDFVIRPGDALQIRVWPDSSLGGRFSVEETGLVYLPVLGEVQAGGRPLSELRRTLRVRYREAMKIPVVEVTPIFNVSVLGAVQRPGLITIEPSRNLFDVISLAGGFTRGAKQSDIRVIRGDQVFKINARDVFEHGDSSLALRLQSGDRVYVPEGRRINILATLLTALQASVLVTTLLTR